MSTRTSILSVLAVVLLTLPLLPIQAEQVITPGIDTIVYFATASQVTAVGGSIIDEYGGFLTARLTSAQSDLLRGQGASLVAVDHTTGRGSYVGDWKLSPPAVPNALRATSSSPYAIVQFRGPVAADWARTLDEKAVAIYDHLPNNAFHVQLTTEGRTFLSALPYVRHIEPYHAAFKLAPWRPTSLESSVYLALAYRDSERSAVVAAVEAAGAAVDLQHTTAREHLIRFDATPSVVESVALVPAIAWIEPTARELTLATTRINEKLQNGPDAPPSERLPLYAVGRGIDGSTQTVGVCDTGIATDLTELSEPNGQYALQARHIAFDDISSNERDLVFNGPLSDHRKVKVYYAPQFPPDSHPAVYYGDGDDNPFGHGTKTAGILAGDSRSLGYDDADGIAFAAKLAVCDLEIGAGFSAPEGGVTNTSHNYYLPDPRAYFDRAYEADARAISNSWNSGNPWGWGASPVYNIGSRQVDDLVRERPDLLLAFAAGNFGEVDVGAGPDADAPGRYGAESLAKNVVGVGMTRNHTDAIHAQSSWDICDRARVKPDLVAQGEWVRGADWRTADNYGYNSSGTSYATPAVTGAAALIRDYFAKGFYPAGVAGGAPIEPHASLVRGVLVASAREIDGDRDCGKYPNAIQGWGMPKLEDALYFQGDARNLRVVDEAETPALLTGGTWSRPLSVAAGQPLRVVLTWTDLGGIPSNNASLVNDLDLVLTSPSGAKYIGNAFVGNSVPAAAPDAKPAPDRLHTTEAVFVPAPPQGTWTVTVRASSVPLPLAPQSFSLAATGAQLAWG